METITEVKRALKRAGLRPVSKKRGKDNAKYLKLRQIHLAYNPVCEAGLQGCLYKSDQIHHKRGRWSKLLTDTEFFMAVCAHCHAWIHANGREARDRGWKL